MKEFVLKAVAAPSTFFWASFQLAITNVIIHLGGFVLYLAITQGKSNPLFILISFFVVHFLLIGLHRREPHSAGIFRNLKFYFMHTKNLDGAKGTKYTV